MNCGREAERERERAGPLSSITGEENVEVPFELY